MSFLVSPGVRIREIDATNAVPAVSSSIGGFAGSFKWGPVSEIVDVVSENQLAAIFGTPDSATYKYFLVAAGFLRYANSLKVVRVATGDQAYAVGTAWSSKYPGALGNSLKVSVITAAATDFSEWEYADQFNSEPTTSSYAASLGKPNANDEMHIVVVDEDGSFTGTAGTILEKFEYVSQASDAKKEDGSTNYYKDIIDAQSNYIKWEADIADLSNIGNTVASVTTSFDTEAAEIEESLTGGADDNTPTAAELQLAYDLFEDAETVDVNLLFGAPDESGNTMANYLISIAESRKDCMAFVSPPISATVNAATPAANVKTWADALTSTSYAAADSSALYVYDKYNDTYRWIAAAGHIAGLCANTDNVADAWYSPAGVNRGQLLNIVKLAFNPRKNDRDTLYKARVNPLVSFPGQGTFLYGDKTLLSKPSAFDRINVRRLFIVLEKAIANAAKAQLFEFNDDFTRAQFRNLVEPFLRDVRGRRGVTDFLVVCDATNNTSQVVDSNQFVADIYIKPTRSINFITLNFIATRSGVEFNEIAGAA
jgi:phage tail sheath protein FI